MGAAAAVTAAGIDENVVPYDMSDISDIHDPPRQGRLDRERQRVTDSLRELADRLDSAPKDQLMHALPIAVAAIGELRKRLSPWLR